MARSATSGWSDSMTVENEDANGRPRRRCATGAPGSDEGRPTSCGRSRRGGAVTTVAPDGPGIGDADAGSGRRRWLAPSARYRACDAVRVAAALELGEIVDAVGVRIASRVDRRRGIQPEQRLPRRRPCRRRRDRDRGRRGRGRPSMSSAITAGVWKSDVAAVRRSGCRRRRARPRTPCAIGSSRPVTASRTPMVTEITEPSTNLVVDVERRPSQLAEGWPPNRAA